MRRSWLLILPAVAVLSWGYATAQQGFIVYPAKGQSQQQMDKDQAECRTWAKKQTGFDPNTASPSAPASQSSVGKSAVKGGAVGALGGLAIGSLSGNAGKGAAIGAATGGVIGGLSAKKKQDDAQKSQEQYYYQRLDEYNRACRACLVGRGYTVE